MAKAAKREISRAERLSLVVIGGWVVLRLVASYRGWLQ